MIIPRASFLTFRRNSAVIVYLSLVVKESQMKILITRDVHIQAMTLLFHECDCFFVFHLNGSYQNYVILYVLYYCTCCRTMECEYHAVFTDIHIKLNRRKNMKIIMYFSHDLRNIKIIRDNIALEIDSQSLIQILP